MATAQELVTGARCIDCGIPDGQKLSVLIYLFSQIAEVSMTAQELVAASNCFNCGISPGQQMAVLIYLADQIAQGGGGGGGSSGVTCSPSSTPSGIPTGSCGIWVQLSTGKMWVYNSGDSNWDPLLG